MVQSSAAQSQPNFHLYNQISTNNHEQVLICNDNATGLRAIIAIHNTVLGPGLGGTRMWAYESEAEAITDVLRLSRGMTYKASISGLNLGGAKAVIIGDAKTMKSEGLMRKFGRFVENLNGKYITAEDVGTTTKDMEYVAMETEHVVGLPESMGGGGDPSPLTAFGTYVGMKASANKAFGSDSLNGKTVAVQGIGKVGWHLLEFLHQEGAKLIISDLNNGVLDRAAKEFGASVVEGNEIYSANCDIYAPCALGATINEETLTMLKCAVIAGAANNQLKDENIQGPALKQRGIVYAPDFVINAGGLINVYSEHIGYNRKRVEEHTEDIYTTVANILKAADERGIHTQLAATQLAEERIQAILGVQSTY